MTRKPHKATPARQAQPQEASDEQFRATDRMYDFGNTPVLLSHPALNGGEVVSGAITGYWVTRPTSREQFEVVSLDANLVLPTVTLQLPEWNAPRVVRPGSIYLSQAKFAVPPHLRRLFPAPNRGKVDVKTRFYTAVFAAYATFPFAGVEGKELPVEPARILWLNVGTVERGGALTSSSLGRIISGILDGLMLCCGCGGPKPPPPAPRRCLVPHPTAGVTCTRPPHGDGGHSNPLGVGYRW